MRNDYKRITKEIYDKYFKRYEGNTRDCQQYIEKELDIFIKFDM